MACLSVCLFLFCFFVNALDGAAWAAHVSRNASEFVLLDQSSLQRYLDVTQRFGAPDEKDYSGINKLFTEDYKSFFQYELIVHSKKELRERLASMKEKYGSWVVETVCIIPSPDQQYYEIKRKWTIGKEAPFISTAHVYSRDGQKVCKLIEYRRV